VSVITVFSPGHDQHVPPHEFCDGTLSPSHETPRRATVIHQAIVQAALGEIVAPRTFGLEPIRAVHTDDYIAYLEHAYQRWVDAGGAPAAVLPDTLAVRWMARRPQNVIAAAGYFAYDMSAPIVAGTYGAARVAADVALTGAALLMESQSVVYALCRPPGHHAGSDMCGGYCYLNNAAIAAEYLVTRAGSQKPMSAVQSPSARPHDPVRVALLDIDVHHGNGSQQIFYARDDVFYVSLHADPARQYPYFSGYADERGVARGVGYTLNMPLAPGIADEHYLAMLQQALSAIAAFAPHYLVLSAGFDTFMGDPVGDSALSAAAYPAIGARIAALGLPTLIVQEGGYAVDTLGQHVVGLLRGFESLPPG
jgi:acetoin utilization deacetylase AcuC-like enzyme